MDANRAVIMPEPTDIIPTPRQLPGPVVSLEAWAQRRQDFNKFVNEQLKKGIDYGEIPGVDRPTLLKPGAEKILQMYGCKPVPEIMNRDLNAAAGHYTIECMMRAVSIVTGETIGFGVGMCSTYESKYRYRWEWWNQRGAPDGDDWEQTRGGKWRRRVENRDLADQWNTVLKIAKKRALVDLALTISGASEKFTQDVEDMVFEGTDRAPASAPPWEEPSEEEKFAAFLKLVRDDAKLLAQQEPDVERDKALRESAVKVVGETLKDTDILLAGACEAVAQVVMGVAWKDMSQAQVRAIIRWLYNPSAKALRPTAQEQLVAVLNSPEGRTAYENATKEATDE